MRSRWVVLQHVEWEGPGMIAREAEKRGCEVDIRRLDRGDKIPTVDHMDGLVVMGGPLGAYEEDLHPFLRKECELLQAVSRSGVPVLGVCLGAQLLAKALGATVFPGHGAEIGFGSIELAGAGREDVLFAGLGGELPAFHWHGDTFTLPEGAVLLASSPMYAHQAFRFGSRAYGLQFHIEPDADTWAAWRDHLPSGMFDEAETKRMQIEESGREVISRFFDLALNTAENAGR
ncbi:MAG TPA: type 1 glutamine amidotransferase [Terracidiphilus sp.]|nr:type 1 glutamine amidotransferase [Terracidiphilus sp.]